jgi:hypothetical protein
MIAVFLSVLQTLRTWARSRAALQLEILALRHQLQVRQRTRPSRIRIETTDRCLWILLARFWAGWRTSLVLVKPETVIAWHRQGFRLCWRWKSRRRIGRPTVPADERASVCRLDLLEPKPTAASRVLPLTSVPPSRSPQPLGPAQGAVDSRKDDSRDDRTLADRHGKPEMTSQITNRSVRILGRWTLW